MIYLASNIILIDISILAKCPEFNEEAIIHQDSGQEFT